MAKFFNQLHKTLILLSRCRIFCIVINLSFHDNSMFIENFSNHNHSKRELP